MHFVGPDQLHGFEERLTTDVYPGRLRLDARLEPAGRAGRLVVPQHELGEGGRRRRDHEPARVRRRGRVPRRPPPVRLRALRAGRAALALRLLQPSTRPVRRAAAATGTSTPTTRSTCRRRRRCRTSELDPHSRRLWDAAAMDDGRDHGRRRPRARHGYYASLSYVDERIGRGARRVRGLRTRRGHDRGLHRPTTATSSASTASSSRCRSASTPRACRSSSPRPGRFAPRRVREPVSLVDVTADAR